jgi:SAM-dependent methyltransferase
LEIPAIPRAISVTHEHLLSVVNTELKRATPARPFRLLDVGCGKGQLSGYLHGNLPLLNPGLCLEVYGLDVSDHGVQPGDYFAETLRHLSTAYPGVEWSDRLALISVRDPWPYPDDHFDAVISNQVLEHVGDHDRLFSEIRRTLKTGGFSAHLFPLEHAILEGHLLLPGVHRVRDHDQMIAYIRLLSRLGLGKYRGINRASPVAIDDFAERHADYMHYFTNYLTLGEALDAAKRCRMRASFRYSGEFYSRKIASILKRPPRYEYRRSRSGLGDWLAISFCKYIASITLFLEKKERYTPAPVVTAATKE